MQEINEILKQRRLELGLTMLDVAKSVGVSEGTVSRWESGDIANMRRDKIAALAKTLNISPAVIMGWEQIEEKPAKISDSEKKILEIYNNLSDDGKKYIMQQLNMAAQVYPKVNQSALNDLAEEISSSLNTLVKNKIQD